MLRQKADYIQPRIVVTESTLSPMQWFFYGVRNLFAVMGVVSLSAGVFFYVQGQRALNHFDEPFRDLLTQLVVQTFNQQDVLTGFVIKVPLKAEVTVEKAIEAMKHQAQVFNMPFVGSYSLIYQDNKTIEILAFMDTSASQALLSSNPDFAMYLPPRVALYQDNHGQSWIVTLRLDFWLFGTHQLPEATKAKALRMQDTLIQIMQAGAQV